MHSHAPAYRKDCLLSTRKRPVFLSVRLTKPDPNTHPESMGKKTGFWDCRGGSHLCLGLTSSLTLGVQAAVGGVAFYISLGMGITVLALGIFTLAKVGHSPNKDYSTRWAASVLPIISGAGLESVGGDASLCRCRHTRPARSSP
jgi:hypothetical protein